MANGSTDARRAGRGQGYGCLGLALFSLLGTALFIILGIQCLKTHELFDCIGLLTIFPAAFTAIALASAAIGLQRFTSTGRRQGLADRLAGMETGWQPLAPPGAPVRPFSEAGERVIQQPAPKTPHSEPTPNTAEDEDA